MQTKQKCGTYEVYENRATKTGRKISLNIVVYPATGDEREPDPLFYFAGGPGSAATEDARGFAPEFAKIRVHRDLVFVDQRGTGKSHPLDYLVYAYLQQGRDQMALEAHAMQLVRRYYDSTARNGWAGRYFPAVIEVIDRNIGPVPDEG